MLHVPTQETTEGLRRPTEQQARDLRQLIFDTYGKRIYGDQNPHNVQRRFHLTYVKLRDLCHFCGPDATQEELERDMIGMQGEPLKALSRANIRRFETLARIARCVLSKRGYDPTFFVRSNCYELAHRLRVNLAEESELIL